MKPENEFSTIIGITMIIFFGTLIGALLENIYLVIGGIIILAGLILYVKFMPIEKKSVGFPEEII